jgi:hypothetical protein
LADRYGNGAEEVANLAEQQPDGKLVVLIRDGRTGKPLRWIGI